MTEIAAAILRDIRVAAVHQSADLYGSDSVLLDVIDAHR